MICAHPCAKNASCRRKSSFVITTSRLLTFVLIVCCLSACLDNSPGQQAKAASPVSNTQVSAAGAVSRAPAPAAAPVQSSPPASATAASRKGAPVFVLNSLDGDVSVIDPATWTEVKRIPTGREPHHLYLTPDEKSVIVANAGADSLTFIDPRTAEEQRTLRGILDPYHLRFSPDMKWFVTAANRLNHIDIYHWDGTTPTLAKRIPTSRTPSHLWIDSRSTTVWATMQDSDELVAIDLATQSLKHRVRTGPMPADVFVTPDDKTLLIGLTGSDGVEVYDVAGGKEPTFVRKILTGKGAHAFRAAGDGQRLYVSNRVANTISRINYQTLVVEASFPAPSGPDCMDISSDGKLIMVGSRWAKKLTVIDVETQKIVRQVNVGKSPHGVWTLDHVGRQ
ncbi:YncE family protein [bacterium BD-1]|nr:YncE family protein [Ottowia caeni]